MIMSPSNMFAVLLLFVSHVNTAVIPYGDREYNEVWSDNYNLVEPPRSMVFFSNMFDDSKSKITPLDRLKSVIKAIYHFDAMKNLHKKVDNVYEDSSTMPDLNIESNDEDKNISNTNEEQKLPSLLTTEQKEINYDTFSDTSEEIKQNENTSIQNDVEEINLQETTPSDVLPTEQTTQKLGLLLEDLVDSIVRIPAHMEVDKTQKFTHSIRYGYGTPFHYKGL